VGLLSAAYLGPVINPLFEQFLGWALPGGETYTVAGFLVGLFGISLTGFLLDLFSRVRAKAEKDTDHDQA
jgi:hypothetical protein